MYVPGFLPWSKYAWLYTPKCILNQAKIQHIGTGKWFQSMRSASGTIHCPLLKPKWSGTINLYLFKKPRSTTPQQLLVTRYWQFIASRLKLSVYIYIDNWRSKLSVVLSRNVNFNNITTNLVDFPGMQLRAHPVMYTAWATHFTRLKESARPPMLKQLLPAWSQQKRYIYILSQPVRNRWFWLGSQRILLPNDASAIETISAADRRSPNGFVLGLWQHLYREKFFHRFTA